MHVAHNGQMGGSREDGELPAISESGPFVIILNINAAEFPALTSALMLIRFTVFSGR